MCAHPDSAQDLSVTAVRDAAHDSNISPAVADKLVGPLADLCAAANQRKVELICSAYLALRRAATGVKQHELFALADTVLGKSAVNLIVSAYSHRHCFMCNGGSVLCEQCADGGRATPGRTCTVCSGLGLVQCGFCSGTGWADRNTIPAEITSAVLARQLEHVRAELHRTVEAMAGLAVGKIRRFPPEERLAITARLMQLRSRLAELVSSGAINDDEEQGRLEAMAEKVRAGLEMLKNH